MIKDYRELKEEYAKLKNDKEKVLMIEEVAKDIKKTLIEMFNDQNVTYYGSEDLNTTFMRAYENLDGLEETDLNPDDCEEIQAVLDGESDSLDSAFYPALDIAEYLHTILIEN